VNRKVDLDELAVALDTDSPELRQFPDLETGHINSVMEEIDWALDRIYDELYDENGNSVMTLEDYLQQRGIPGWQWR
jgi:hypothetical protein